MFLFKFTKLRIAIFTGLVTAIVLGVPLMALISWSISPNFINDIHIFIVKIPIDFVFNDNNFIKDKLLVDNYKEVSPLGIIFSMVFYSVIMFFISLPANMVKEED
ncbi:MAG: hypothetical protein COV29_00505 [Candidatus Yanofskybacteria bacterium CG10_big_fil_rev_8_21_14_0_10_36_16]|uniref:Uncharacterized protein n=1 Tax=Candidatus Yanofskybacteria bacterium CG10_big_fil_rev_8_21_14_0_10_36_16 TaxID=1975096 RepID=A0A2J0Q8D3_9BACT|nr:MAG: hypothetical protein COV29_00505 [Candidatus Yanofskybacteria bacterium CG10_big_fil_rev_8_21_14_0_10_36_16]